MSLAYKLQEQAEALKVLHSLSRSVDDEYSIMSRLLKKAPVLFVVAGRERFEYVSPRWTEVLGWSEKELTSQPWINFVHPEDQERTIHVRDESMRLSEVHAFVNRYLHRDGRYIPLVWFATEWDASGRCYALVGVCRNGEARCLWHSQPYCVNGCGKCD